MNYGRFFKLNQDLSNVVNGVIVFDYTELPAHEGVSAGTSMSPKYPISMSITANAIRFKMHYCVFCGTNKQQEPIYGNSVDEIILQLKDKSPHDYELNVEHMEEVILELPFSGIETNKLTDIIKKSYNTAFPQIPDKDSKKLPNDLYLKTIIEKVKKKKNHNATSYSTLWSMELYMEDGTINLRSNQNDKFIDKFLRKLLLDFMFDLKHSDLFQICPRYDQMYSGLMANFYFSALMHKCEYYYYRDITTQAIESKKKLGISDEKKIIYLYANELFAAEEKWANDIRNPLSDKCFEQEFPDDFAESGKSSEWGRFRSEFASAIWERMSSKHWDSWFASPEEEMRRIYFLSTVDNQQTTICNSVSLTEHLHLDFNDSDDTENDASTKKALVSLSRESRGKSSQWFLNRYDYNDALHLHLFKHTNLLIVLFAIFALICIVWCKHDPLIFSYLKATIDYLPYILLPLALTIAYVQWLKILYKQENNKNNIIFRYRLLKKGWVLGAAAFFIINAFLYRRIFTPLGGLYRATYLTAIIISVLIIIANTIIPLFKRHKWNVLNVSIHPIKSWHMFLPKLTASITAAWIPLTTGFKNYTGFLQSGSSTAVLITIVFVVMVFFMYLVYNACPSCSSWVKVLRSFEQLLISFCISLTIGAICLSLIDNGHSSQDSIIPDQLMTWINLSLIAMFVGLFLNAIFRPKNQMTDI